MLLVHCLGQDSDPEIILSLSGTPWINKAWINKEMQEAWVWDEKRWWYLLVASESSVHGGVDHPVQTHSQRVDVLHLPRLALCDQRTQLKGFILNHLAGVLQRTHLHLQSTHSSHTGRGHPGFLRLIHSGQVKVTGLMMDWTWYWNCDFYDCRNHVYLVIYIRSSSTQTRQTSNRMFFGSDQKYNLSKLVKNNALTSV